MCFLSSRDYREGFEDGIRWATRNAGDTPAPVETLRVPASPIEVRPKRKPSAYSKRYKKAFKNLMPRFKLKSGKWKKNGFKLLVRAAHKAAKK